MSSKEAVKHDEGKPRMELLSVPALEGLAKAMTFGAGKYDEWNWTKGFDWSRLYGSALRHIMSHMNGENTDPESDLSHLDHAMACLMMLSTHEKCNLGNDDRNPIEKTTAYNVPYNNNAHMAAWYWYAEDIKVTLEGVNVND